MNNNLYHWHAEQLVRFEMREINHAAEQARLLGDTGLSGTSWLTHALNGLGNWLRARRKGLQDHRSIGRKSFPRKSPGSA